MPEERAEKPDTVPAVFPGIDLTPEALALREQAESMLKQIDFIDEAVGALGDATDKGTAERRKVAKAVRDAMKKSVDAIERTITTV